MTIPKDSKLYRRDDYYISQNEDAHNNGLPAVKTQRKLAKERSTQINVILKGLIRERLIGCLINEDVLTKSEDTHRLGPSSFRRGGNTVLLPLPK
jgi:hypothetical protein